MLFLALFLATADASKFEAVTTQSKVTGELTAFGPSWSVTLGKQSVASGTLVEMRQIGAARPGLPKDRQFVKLANGDVWPARIVSLIDDKLRITADFGTNQDLTLPVSAIEFISFSSLKTASDLPTSRAHDEVYLSNGDVVRGTVVRFAKGEVLVEASGKSSGVPVDRIARIVFSSELTRAPKRKGPVAVVTLANGGRVTLVEGSFQDGRLTGKTMFGLPARFLSGDVVHIAILGGPATYLSDLKPASYEHTPYLSKNWTLAVDRNTDGGPLQIGLDTFDRGIGMHSKSQVTYAVPPGATRFESWVGLDTVAGAKGRVDVSVTVDGKAQFGPVELSGGQVAQRVAFGLPGGAKQLVLSVDFGAGGDVQDHVDWGDARFVTSR